MRMSYVARYKVVPMALILGLGWLAGQPLKADDKPGLWSSVKAALPGKGTDKSKASDAAKESSSDKPGAVLKEMVGTWVGFEDGKTDVQHTLVLKKDGTYEFKLRMAGETAKKMPKGVSLDMGNPEKGTYTFKGSSLVMDNKGEVGAVSKPWKMVDNVLVLGGKLKLKRTK